MLYFDCGDFRSAAGGELKTKRLPEYVGRVVCKYHSSRVVLKTPTWLYGSSVGFGTEIAWAFVPPLKPRRN